ncbi:MAG: hypothetical protein ACYCXW_10475 [Solirubrobacteraceae bacterium]
MAAAGALIMAVPAAAHPGPSNGHGHPNGHGNHNGGGQPAQSHKCRPHDVAYIESGTVDAATPSTLARNSDGTWSGTLVVDVKSADHAAKTDRQKASVTYTLTDAKLRVRFDKGTSASAGFTAGERVKLIGKLATVGKNCTALRPAPTPVFRMLIVHPGSQGGSAGQTQ